MPQPRPIPEVLIVLGASLNPQGQPGRVSRLRLLHALELWRTRFPESRILVTGGRRTGDPVSEARAMADWSLAWVEEAFGPETRERLAQNLILEEISHNTAASARNTLPLVQSQQAAAVGLISDTLHLRRAHFLFKRHFSRHGIAVLPLPATGLLQQYWQHRRYLWLTKMALREGGAWAKVLGQLMFRGRSLK
jgi:uncharacterized SAM-binding protein YcdF (DUF218 family)